MTRLLALDQSSKITGYAIFDGDTLEQYGKWSFDDSDPIARIDRLRQKVLNMIKDEDIEKVVIEDIQLQANNNNVVTYKMLAFTMAGILLLCKEVEIPCETIASSTWKSQCGVKGKGRTEQKQNAQKFVQESFEVKATQDVVDAICIGYGYLKKAGSELNWA